MEENEETSSNVKKYPILEIGDKLLETEELKITDQCDFVPDSVPKLDNFESVVDDSTSAKEEKTLIVVNELENFVTVLNDSRDGGDELMSLDKEDKDKDEAVAEERQADTVSGGGNLVTELNDTQLLGVESVSDVKDGGAVAEEADTEMEMEVKADAKAESDIEAEPEPKAESKETEAEAEMKMELDKGNDGAVEEKDIMEMEPIIENGGGRENASELQDKEEANLELIGADLHNVAEDAVVEEENLIIERETKTGKEAEVAKVDGTESVPELDAEENEMETEKEAEVAKVDGTESVPELDGEEDKMETEKEAEAAKVEGGDSVSHSDDLQLAEDEEDETTVGEEEVPSADTEMETETDAAESVKVSGGKWKRGRNSKVPTKAPVERTIVPVEEEDVCFVCFDGGDLVLCDRKNCPKAYHPSCINRDEKFFRAKGRWNCGWHQCSRCAKNAYYMCYTCTFSLCKGCIKDDVILCVRGNKGFCEICIKTVNLIEDNVQGNKAQVDFNDKSSFEYLFKDYLVDLKEKLSLSSVELAQAKNPWKGPDVLAGKYDSPDEQLDAKDDGGYGFENSSDNPEASKSKRRNAKKRPKYGAKEEELTSEAVTVGSEGMSTPRNIEWASKELLEFVMHMKDGDRAVLSQFDVQALLLEYIKRNKLRDPRRKSQIICDARLENIFGKARVGHFEMLKLLESHFLIKEDAQIDDVQGSVVDTEVNHLDADGNTESLTKGGKDRKRKTRKKDGRGRQSNLDDYAAIDIHNISLIYLRRKLMEDLLEDIETFHDKVVGTFVRIRISGSNQKQDIYRLVQVVGTSKTAELYKVGKRTTDIMLEILNLNKTEVISIDSISNQEFTEDECKRLRQSIKCGLINRLIVGDILDKAMEVQVARVNDAMGCRKDY